MEMVFEYYKYKGEKIGAKHNAILNYAEEGGFIGWHTNWNASRNIKCYLRSLDGNGYFNYLDNKTNEIVTMQDKKGWQCRWFYFGERIGQIIIVGILHILHVIVTMAVKFDDLNYLHGVKRRLDK